jgi:hypothetical protein
LINHGFGHLSEVLLKTIFVPCLKIVNDSNGGLNRTVRTTISIGCYARFWPKAPVQENTANGGSGQ